VTRHRQEKAVGEGAALAVQADGVSQGVGGLGEATGAIQGRAEDAQVMVVKVLTDGDLGEVDDPARIGDRRRRQAAEAGN
jgi:hypothetical protein